MVPVQVVLVPVVLVPVVPVLVVPVVPVPGPLVRQKHVGVVRGLFWVDLAMFWKGDIWQFGANLGPD